MDYKIKLDFLKDKIYLDVLKIFLIWFGALIIIGFYAFQVLPKQIISQNLVDSLSNWDGQHFLQIVDEGYKDPANYAFFPLYPLMIKLVSSFLHVSPLISGLLISLLSTIGSLVYFIKLLKVDFKEADIKEVITLFLFFPTSFFLITIYSESLFLFLTLATFYYARSKNYFLASLLGILAPLTRIVGLAVIVALFVEVLSPKIKLKDKFWILLSPIGFLGYCFYLYTTTGNPFYFLVSEQAWERNIIFPGLNIWYAMVYLIQNNRFLVDTGLFIDVLISVIGLGIALRSIRFLKPMYVAYTIGALFIPMVTPSLVSMPRFLLVVFPLFILIYKIKNANFQFFYRFFSVLLLSFYLVLFVNGFWVS